MLYWKYYLWGILVATLLVACQSDSSIPRPETSEIEVSMKITRYEQSLIALDTNQLETSFQQHLQTYPAFSDLYFNNVVPINEDGMGPLFYAELKNLITDPRFISLVDTVGIVFPDFEKNIGAEFEQAFKYFKHYFPEFSAPEIYTLVSEYAYQVFLFSTEDNREGLGLGLDLFLGADFPYGSIAPGHPSFSKYLTRTFNRDHLVKKGMEAIINDRWPAKSQVNMLDYMIDRGKKLYLLQHLLPETSDTIIMEYSADQLAWVKENELSIWSYFLGEKLFYETNMLKINKYINPSPDSPGMPPEAPGRTGNYMGWQIIKSYMEKNPQLTLADLMDTSDAQSILNAARYKPAQRK